MVLTGTAVMDWLDPVAVTSRDTPVGRDPVVRQAVPAADVTSRQVSPLASTGVTVVTTFQVARLVVDAHSARFAWPAPWVVVVTCAVTVPTVVWPRASAGRRSRRSVALRSMGRDSARAGPTMQA